MKDRSEKLAELLRAEWEELNAQKNAIHARLSAINTLLGAQVEPPESAPESAEVPAKVKRGRRTNAQIAADKAAAEAAIEAQANEAIRSHEAEEDSEAAE